MKSTALFSTLLLALFLSLFAACSDDSSSSPTGEAAPATKPRGKTLVAYFSRTGNTKPLAEYAAEYLDATLFEITAKIP